MTTIFIILNKINDGIISVLFGTYAFIEKYDSKARNRMEAKGKARWQRLAEKDAREAEKRWKNLPHNQK